MYLLYKNKYGLIIGFVGLFNTVTEAENYINSHVTSEFTYKIIFVERYVV